MAVVTMKNLKAVARRYRIESGKGFRLKDYDPADTWNLHSKSDAAEALKTDSASGRRHRHRLRHRSSFP